MGFPGTPAPRPRAAPRASKSVLTDRVTVDFAAKTSCAACWLGVRGVDDEEGAVSEAEAEAEAAVAVLSEVAEDASVELEAASVAAGDAEGEAVAAEAARIASLLRTAGAIDESSPSS